MNDTTSPFFVALLFILRCLVPLAILFGISYLLRKWGLVAVEASEEPKEKQENGGGNVESLAFQEQNKPAEKNVPGENSNKPNTAETPRSRTK